MLNLIYGEVTVYLLYIFQRNSRNIMHDQFGGDYMFGLGSSAGYK